MAELASLISKFSKTSLRFAGLWQKTQFQKSPFRVPQVTMEKSLLFSQYPP